MEHGAWSMEQEDGHVAMLVPLSRYEYKHIHIHMHIHIHIHIHI